MRRLFVLFAIALAGCGSDEQARVPAACLKSDAAIQRALRAAPRPVRLEGGVRLSECMTGAEADAEIQAFGVLATRIADRLRDRGDGLALGYLLGAVRLGSTKTNGTNVELVRRLEGAARGVASHPDLQRGIAAGERTG